jgi:hypothetical protein
MTLPVGWSAANVLMHSADAIKQTVKNIVKIFFILSSFLFFYVFFMLCAYYNASGVTKVLQISHKLPVAYIFFNRLQQVKKILHNFLKNRTLSAKKCVYIGR